MAQPPTNFLGCPIECTSVRIADVSAFQPPPSIPQVLHIRNIPDESPNLLNQSLQRLFIKAGYTMTKCIISGNEAYVKFQDQKCKEINLILLLHIYSNTIFYTNVKLEFMLSTILI